MRAAFKGHRPLPTCPPASLTAYPSIPTRHLHPRFVPGSLPLPSWGGAKGALPQVRHSSPSCGSQAQLSPLRLPRDGLMSSRGSGFMSAPRSPHKQNVQVRTHRRGGYYGQRYLPGHLCVSVSTPPASTGFGCLSIALCFPRCRITPALTDLGSFITPTPAYTLPQT